MPFKVEKRVKMNYFNIHRKIRLLIAFISFLPTNMKSRSFINSQLVGRSKGDSINAKRLLFLFGIILGLVFPIFAQAATTLTVEPITWNIIGLDSNDESVGPNHFPVGARVCNTGASTATNVRASFVWDSSNTYVNLRPGTAGSGSPGAPADLPVSGTIDLDPGECTDFYFEVEVTRDEDAYDTAREYHISITADAGATTGSTPTPRELYVESLIS